MTAGPGFTDLFSEGAHEYARHRPRYPIALVELLASVAPSRALAWDCGCGSGQLSELLVERFDRVIATDASAEQIAVAEPHERVEYRVALAESSGLEEASTDLTVAAQAAHWFDLDRFYAEVRRVSASGAAVALVTYNVMRIAPDIDTIIDDFYWNALAGYWPAGRQHVDDAYRSLAFPFEELAWPAMNMAMDWRVADVIGYIETWSAVRALAKDRGRAIIDELHGRLVALWGSSSAYRQVRLPISLRLGRV